MTYSSARVVEQNLEVLDGKVGHANVADLAGADQLLHLAPRVDKVPVLVDLLLARHHRRGPVNQVQVDIVGAELGQRVVERRGDALVVDVEELGGQPDLVARHARVLDARADLGLVAVGGRRVDVAVAGLEGGLDGGGDLVGLGLPGAEANGGDLVARVEGKGLTSARRVRTRGGRKETEKRPRWRRIVLGWEEV